MSIMKRIQTNLVGQERNAQLFVDHKGKDTHHGSTALVELDSTLLELGGGIKGIPAVVDGAVTEVTNVLGSAGKVLHDASLQKTDEKKKLAKSTSRNGLEGGKTVGDGSERSSTQVNVSRKTDTGLLDEVTDNGKHGDTSVLELSEAEAVELLLVTVCDKAERIEEAKRRLGTEFILEL